MRLYTRHFRDRPGFLKPSHVTEVLGTQGVLTGLMPPEDESSSPCPVDPQDRASVTGAPSVESGYRIVPGNPDARCALIVQIMMSLNRIRRGGTSSSTRLAIAHMKRKPRAREQPGSEDCGTVYSRRRPYSFLGRAGVHVVNLPKTNCNLTNCTGAYSRSIATAHGSGSQHLLRPSGTSSPQPDSAHGSAPSTVANRESYRQHPTVADR